MRGVAWSPNGNILASCGDDGTVRLWNPNSGVNYAVLRGHTESVRGVVFSRDGETLVSAGWDVKVRFWDVNTRRLLRTIGGFGTNQNQDIAWHRSGQMFAVGNLGGIRLTKFSPGRSSSRRLNDGIIRCSDVDFHPNGNFLAGAFFDSKVRIFKLITVNRLDVNKDGKVDINDLIAVARDYGKTGERSTDVNNDKRVDIKDLTEVAKAINPDFAAPSLDKQPATLPFTVEEVQQWIQDAKKQGIDDEGIATLEQLLQAILHQAAPPKETALLANYPNPFNPETWIPYQLATPAEVTVSIHTTDGTLVRTLALGQLPAGSYADKDRAAYWDGKNEQGESVASGVYFYTLKAGEFSATKKMLIQK